MLFVFAIGEDYVSINHPIKNRQRVYGAKLVSATENLSYLLFERVEDFYLKFRQKGVLEANKFFHLVLLKEKVKPAFYNFGEERRDMYEVHLYAFTFDKEMLEYLPSDWKIMEGHEIANALLKVHTLSTGAVLKEREIDDILSPFRKRRGFPQKLLRSGKDFYETIASLTPEEKIYRQYAETLLEMNEDARVYGSASVAGEEINWEKLLSIPFEGSLWITAIFNPADVLLEKYLRSPIEEVRKAFKQYLEEYKKGLPLFLNHTVLISKYPLDSSQANEIFEAIGFKPWEIKKYREEYIENTPLMFIYENYIQPAFVNRLTYFFPYGLKKFTTPAREIEEKEYVFKPPKIQGIDRFNTRVEYSNFDHLKEKVVNPHIAYVAPAGTGKSFSIQQFVSQVLELTPEKIEKLWNGEKFDASSYRTDIKIRYFDKGYSALKFFDLLRVRGFDVSIFAINPEEVFFNPLTHGLDFSIGFTNLLLELMRDEPLTGSERKFFEKAYKIALKESDKWFCRNTLLKNLPAHLENLKRYVVENFGKQTLNLKVNELVYHTKNPEFDAPIYTDMLRVINDEKGKETYTRAEREIWESLLRKIRLISETPFNAWTKIDLKNARLFYMDIEELAKWEFFPALMMGVLRILIETDKRDSSIDPTIATYYVFDEVQNLLKTKDNKKIEGVANVLKLLLREARRFRISIMLATQDWYVFPVDILENLATKILVLGAEKDRERLVSQIKSLPQVFGEETGDIEKLALVAPFRYALCIYPNGVFTYKLPLTPIVHDIFSSYNRKLKTPDGIEIGLTS